MEEAELTRLSLTVSLSEATTEEVDQLTRQLLSELKQLDVESVALAADQPAPAGSKAADPVTIGSIAVAVLPAVLPKVVEVVQGWTQRSSNRAVKFKGKIAGQTIEFEGSPEDLHRLLARLSRGSRKR